ncbi:hypothetical protein M9H77_35743 [Catharanthus roseus]|uniref:Uncharacterized protein n=1 Tax=Catharanthus roseus TaxID=4058 RepID=A0ACB9ZQM1_CATRO|nr:hypothetical protein M9H77_35743 [Catharanthus roseus]
MTIDPSYPIFTVRWLAVHVQPTITLYPDYRAMTQSNSNKQNHEHFMKCGGEMADTTGTIPFWIIGIVTSILVISLTSVFFYGSYSE